jgi:hypothetical protein
MKEFLKKFFSSFNIEFETNELRPKNPQEMYDVKLIKKVLASVNLLFIIFGTIGNFCTFLLLMRRNIRKHSCMRYLATLCIFDLFCLYTWNFSLVYRDLFTNIKIEFEGPTICRLFSFYSYFILQSSSWVICWIGMDRIITLLCKSSTSKISKLAKNNKLVTSLILSLFFLFNFVVLILNAEPYLDDSDSMTTSFNFTNTRSFNQTQNKNNTNKRTFSCYSPVEFYKIWDIVHITMYSILPFTIIFCENLAISYLTFKNSNKINSKHKSINPTYSTTGISITDTIETTQQQVYHTTFQERIRQVFDKKQRNHRKRVNIHANEINNNNNNSKANSSITSVKDKVLLNHAKRSKKMNSKRSQVANLLLFLTVSFFCTTLPYSMYYALGFNEIKANTDLILRDIIIGVLSLLQFARHSANFLIYLFTSSIIRAEIKQIYRNFKCKQSIII